jgi:hypothetical protein
MFFFLLVLALSAWGTSFLGLALVAFWVVNLVLALVVALDVGDKDCLCMGVVSAVRALAFPLALRRLGFGRVLFAALGGVWGRDALG